MKDYNWIADFYVMGSLFAVVLIGMLTVKIHQASQPKPRGATRIS